MLTSFIGVGRPIQPANRFAVLSSLIEEPEEPADTADKSAVAAEDISDFSASVDGHIRAEARKWRIDFDETDDKVGEKRKRSRSTPQAAPRSDDIGENIAGVLKIASASEVLKIAS